MLIAVTHTTRYAYDAPARYAIQSLRLTPPRFDGQRVIEWAVTAPGIETAVHFVDGFGNAGALITQSEEHTEIEIVACGLVETADTAGVVRGLAEAAPVRVYLRQTAQTKPDGAIEAMAAGATGANVLDRLHHLMGLIRDRIDYETGATTSATTAAEAVLKGRGVCQDHAHVFVAAARCLGVPARYVNGYFLSGAPMPEAAHHAWAEARVPNLGWVGFDVANRICPGEHYVRLAWGLDAATASPIRGRRPGNSQDSERLTVVVDVQERPQSMQQQQQQG